MRPVRCQPHPRFLPRPGQPSIRYSAICGWRLETRGMANYIVGIRPAPPEAPITEPELAAWRARWRATCSDKTARTLCALERDFAPR